MKVFESIMGVIAVVLVSVVALLRLILQAALAIIGFTLTLIFVMSPLILVGFIAWVIFN